MTNNKHSIGTASSLEAYQINDYTDIRVERKQSKYNIPVGCLVFIRTIDPYHSLYGANYTTPYVNINIPNVNPWAGAGLAYPSPPAYNYYPDYSARPVWIAPQTTTIDKTSYKVSEITTSKAEAETHYSNKETLKKLFEVYNKQAKTSSSNNLTMVVTSKRNKRLRQKKNPGNFVTSTSTGTVNLRGATVTTNSLGNTPTKMIQPEYLLRGYESVQDCMLKMRQITIRQEDHYSEKELTDSHRATGNYPEFGKPFSGIVVDKFVPTVATEKGEKFNVAHQTFYKVLINENTCLWIEADTVFPMKPEECPLNEEYNEEMETK